ncbi:MAG: M20/M25/M40 family metallo-hydrolase [Nitrososphaerales archaeon]|nr:M20/M25/M40 family metallo-hydrolase [Nitrososphaerales archaeon]
MSGVGPDPVRLLVGALRIYSPTAQEGRMASYLCTQMKLLGYKRVRVDSAGNAIGEIGSGTTKVLLCGHMDTVPGRLPVKREGDMVFGRGAADAKSPLCALLLAGSRARDAGVHLTFVGATREEGDSLGIQTIIRSGKKYDYAAFGEPSGANRVTIGYRGRVSMRVRIETEGGHAGSPWAHVSAVDEFYSVLGALRRYAEGRRVAEDRFRSLSVSPTLVAAGSYHNVIPPVCRATFDVRLPPGASITEVKTRLRRAASESVRGKTSVTVDFDEATEPYEADPNSILVRSFQRAILIKLKSRPVFVRKTGTGDMNTLASATGAQCVTYGPADSQLSHTDEEAVSVKDYLNSVEVLVEAIKQLGTLRGRARAQSRLPQATQTQN